GRFPWLWLKTWLVDYIREANKYGNTAVGHWRGESLSRAHKGAGRFLLSLSLQFRLMELGNRRPCASRPCQYSVCSSVFMHHLLLSSRSLFSRQWESPILGLDTNKDFRAGHEYSITNIRTNIRSRIRIKFRISAY
ncbi:hypothetical protein P152DRAFT_9751, partial [Eremomyces bilateralis CBS 781.70]